MAIWTNTNFKGHWPIGTAAVVVAENTDDATEILNGELVRRGLEATAKPSQFEELKNENGIAVVLCDGDY